MSSSPSSSQSSGSSRKQQIKSYALTFLAYLPILIYTHTIWPSSSSSSTLYRPPLLTAWLKLVFYSTILLAISLVNKSLTPPTFPSPHTPKVPTERKEQKEDDKVKDSISPFVSPSILAITKGIISLVGIYHGSLSLLLSSPSTSSPSKSEAQILQSSSSILSTLCPNHSHLNLTLFTFSPLSSTLLLLIISSSLLRLLAFKQLGQNFTFNLQKPSGLVTNGLYAWVRHPSYTFLILSVAGVVGLFGRADGVVACWVGMSEEGVWWWWVGSWGVVLVEVVVLTIRVREEERLLEREFGGRGNGWEEWVRRTGRFVPWVF